MSEFIKPRSSVPSPCVSICALNEDDLCVGCFRTGLEISQWGSLTDEQKREVMQKVYEREKDSYI